jgi:hypothetical protein
VVGAGLVGTVLASATAGAMSLGSGSTRAGATGV